jgi:hypothetical protein
MLALFVVVAACSTKLLSSGLKYGQLQRVLESLSFKQTAFEM